MLEKLLSVHTVDKIRHDQNEASVHFQILISFSFGREILRPFRLKVEDKLQKTSFACDLTYCFKKNGATSGGRCGGDARKSLLPGIVPPSSIGKLCQYATMHLSNLRL